MKDCESVIEYLFQVNDELNRTFRNEGINDDISEIVPLDVMKNDTVFFNYMKSSNEKYLFDAKSTSLLIIIICFKNGKCSNIKP